VHPDRPLGGLSNLALDTYPIIALLVVIMQAAKAVQVLFRGHSPFNVVEWFGREY